MKRFPFGLTATALLAFAILVALGIWQLRRLAWKTDLLAKVAALQGAPAQPIGAILANAAQGGDVEYRRVAVDCLRPDQAQTTAYRYAVRDGEVAWRLLSLCRLGGMPFDGILVDRGIVSRFNGEMAPKEADYASPKSIVGVLRAPGGKPWLGPAEATVGSGPLTYRVVDRAALNLLAKDNGVLRPAPYLLAAESEEPAPAGLVPAALPQEIPNNHLVYALTWFALAGILVWVYGTLLLNRLRRP